MKNVDILPEQEVPASIRLDVYKKALDLLENNLDKFKVLGGGLCLVLPCILWGMPCYNSFTPSGDRWEWWDTSFQFPELTGEQIDYISNHPYHDPSDTVYNRRIEVLKQAIETVTKLLT